MDSACLKVARTAAKFGFRDSEGADLTKDEIKTLRAELLARRGGAKTAHGTLTEKQLFLAATKDRGRLYHDRFRQFLRDLLGSNPRRSRSDVVAMALEAFAKASPLRRP